MLKKIQPKSTENKSKVSTIGGKYTCGDSRTNPTGYVKLVNKDEFDKWQAGFDKIDIAPKDGKLSAEEICNYRDNQTRYAKIAIFMNPLCWFKPDNMVEVIHNIRVEDQKTAQYRQSVGRFY